MKKPKVAFYGIKYFPSKGGTSRVAENIIRQLKNRYDITILCYKNNDAKEHINGVKVMQFNQWPGGSIGALFYFLRSALHLKFRKFDVIHLHKIDAAFFLPLFRKKTNIVATSHESAYLRDKWSKIEKWYLQKAEKIFLKSSATLTCISNPLTKIYNNGSKNKVVYIPNGITIKDEYKEREANHFLEEYYLKEKEYFIFAARRIMKTKGCHTMLAALDKMNYKGTIIVAGDLSHAKEYVSELQEKYKHMKVIYPGYIGDLPLLLTLIKKSKLFIFPSETEGMSIMLLEAASTQTPIVASDIKENKEVFNDEHVTFFKDQNSDDLVEKIKLIEENTNVVKSKAQKALLHIKTKYNWANIAESYDEIYRQTINK
ncbi:glycosyltransferase family 4 protein [Carboxylicivirga marina]|uniref:Glycosyltransferase family 4 protein n=1 Tax=Carboxylicivirga marina TaxID=2800988 RepID=A0ABS1HQ26_9BACT|nr:glycosyltransferase family 4 protein [Carboxylicivirga marina]MBK3519751.1 glycosyltransferase family 4 protein [Carboxylicivirga marina]